jgi:hypothetical protein
MEGFEGEVHVHNHVYNEHGMLSATSAGGARMQALDTESAALLPVPHPAVYVSPCSSDTARRNLAELIQVICNHQLQKNTSTHRYNHPHYRK